jgi:hypothetical protein
MIRISVKVVADATVTITANKALKKPDFRF